MNVLCRILAWLIPALGVLTMALLSLEYVHDRNESLQIYGRLVESVDALDAAQNALTALKDAQFARRSYALSGTAANRPLYLESKRNWDDEIGVLELISKSDKTASAVRRFHTSGSRMLHDLDANQPPDTADLQTSAEETHKAEEGG